MFPVQLCRRVASVLSGVVADGNHQGDDRHDDENKNERYVMHKFSGFAVQWPLRFPFGFLAGKMHLTH